ncbi:hypothetical protein CRYUN_Cryun37aG0062400 [Craigia yunnanensis]
MKAVKSGFIDFQLKGKTKLVYRKCRSFLKHQSNWVEKMQGTLMLVATTTTTISFQLAISPPGGVWQQDYRLNRCDQWASSQEQAMQMAYINSYDHCNYICVTYLHAGNDDFHPSRLNISLLQLSMLYLLQGLSGFFWLELLLYLPRSAFSFGYLVF